SAGCSPRSCSGAAARARSRARRRSSRCPTSAEGVVGRAGMAVAFAPSHARAKGVSMREVDVAIVGAGPTGLFAAYYAGFRGLSTAVIDALPEPGGQVTAMYPEKMIFDVAGFPVIRGRDLVVNLVRQAEPFNPEYLLGVRANDLSYVDDKPVLTLSDGTTLH